MDEIYYWYKARLTDSHSAHPVYDGDTVRLDIDLGFYITRRNEPVRLARIDAPEVRGEEREEGLLARDFVRDILSGEDLKIHTYRDTKGSWGRFIADIIIKSSGVCLNDLLVEKGYAEYKNY